MITRNESPFQCILPIKSSPIDRNQAEPSIEALGWAMRAAHGQQEVARAKGRQARADMVRQYAQEPVARLVVARLQQIARTLIRPLYAEGEVALGGGNSAEAAARHAADVQRRSEIAEFMRQQPDGEFEVNGHTPFPPDVAPRFPHMSEMDALFSCFSGEWCVCRGCSAPVENVEKRSGDCRVRARAPRGE